MNDMSLLSYEGGTKGKDVGKDFSCDTYFLKRA
jgi:hypothetical protein